MSKQRKNVVPILGLVACVAAWVVGSEVRTRQDIGASVVDATKLGLRSIVASNDETRPIGEKEFFAQLAMLLEREYVDPVENEEKLAQGAVRGMVAGLLEPESRFMDKEAFEAWNSALDGKVEGLGADLGLQYDEALLAKARQTPRSVDGLLLLPDLVVRSVYPGSPAEAVGLRPGDRIYRVEGKWVISSADVEEARRLRDRATKGQVPPAELAKARAEFQQKTRSAKLAAKARDELTAGVGRSFEIEFERSGKRLKASAVTARTPRPAVRTKGGVVALQFVRGAGKALGALPDGPLTIDLRNSGQGDPGELVRCLEAVAPAGHYGVLAGKDGARPRPVTTEKGRKRGPIRLIVDSTTYGVAEAFALALFDAGLAVVEGKSAGRPNIVATAGLPDGSGYTLLTSRWMPEAGR